jgi:putative Holliday junction resolvase
VSAIIHWVATILAFDFGTRHVGVAVGDGETGLAHALGVIHAESSAERMSEIDPLVREWQPAKLVVGLPLTMDGAELEMTARARRFARQLAARFQLPVDLADERLSSASAEEGLRAAGRGGRKHKQLVHGEAARIILQSYLDESARR